MHPDPAETGGGPTDGPPPESTPLRLERAPDPGTRRLSRLASLVTLGLILIVAVLQQATVRASSHAAPPSGASAIHPPQFPDSVLFYGKVVLAQRQLAKAPGGATGADPSAGLLFAEADSVAVAPADRLRVAILAGEVLGADAALKRLDQLEDADEPLEGDLADDARTLRQIYLGEPPADADIAALKQRHGWFGRVAEVFGTPSADPRRDGLVGPGVLVAILLMLVALVGAGALFIAGCVIGPMLLLGVRSGRRRRSFVPPAPGGSLAIEIVAVFVASFMTLKLIAALLATAVDAGFALGLTLIGQWLLVGVLLWPRVRGVRWSQARQILGLSAPRGLSREIAAGVVGYVAVFPLLVAGVLSALVVIAVQAFMTQMRSPGAPPPPPPENPIIEMAGGGTLAILGIFLLATIWAPLVEEVVFRGALYRHLRARWAVLPAAIVSAIAFGVMHGYPALLLGPVIGLGTGFALLREWRGSIVSCMTAHALHNGAVFTFLVILVSLLGD